MTGIGFSVPGHQHITDDQARALFKQQADWATANLLPQALKEARINAAGPILAAYVSTSKHPPSKAELEKFAEAVSAALVKIS